ncbi:hypothetical protein AEP_00453 [Curvibacter sp. AEP1-3]|uniref:gp53-like domain-containing protein n=1 Tax=Curvibacter sp. AEP1-3 TaxID=1844971 RepID=UPI000B3C0A56|nr:hypothetical protein [Curvibacter sp. AEP1-3]ARV17415.1 hypothetical protein AEP_00453 [Curvibacter sp. AEP1-3]QDB70152.1 tail fiber protein [Curvibacter phage TJ1]
MDYTSSNAFATDVGTGQRLHQQSAAVTTAVTDQDMNGLIWEILAVIKAAGLAPQAFDKTVVASYTQLLQAIRSFQGSFSDLVSITGSVTLTASATGKTHLLGGSGSYTVTLPLAASVPVGSVLSFAASTGSVSVTRQGSNQIFPNSSGTNTVVLNNGDNLTLVSSGSAWIATGGTAVLGNALQSFGNSLGANGYQRLPTGLIVQWGGGVTAGSSVTVTFPVAFPSQMLAAYATYNGASSAFFGTNSINSAQMTVTGNSVNQTFSWFAIGK